MGAHILVAEDDRRQAEILRRYLESEGYDTAVVHDGQAALAHARRRRPDLLILDVMMPQLNGMDVCRILRHESTVLVLMLTARSGEDDLLQGLDMGADDYLTKPYSPRELMARVRTLLRRVGRPAQSDDSAVIRVGRLVIDQAGQTVTVAGHPVECTPGEFAILAAMAAQPNRVFTRLQLLECTRGIDRESTNRAIDTHMVNLRRKIEVDPRRPECLLTVYGSGYKLAGKPTRLETGHGNS
jgi:DNA-binding response OmpR family regulator